MEEHDKIQAANGGPGAFHAPWSEEIDRISHSFMSQNGFEPFDHPIKPKPGHSKKTKEPAAEFAYMSSYLNVSSHDLREPLRKIQTFSSRILEKEAQNLSESGREYFDRIRSSARRMQSVVNDLMALAAIDSNAEKFTRTNLDELFERVKKQVLNTNTVKNVQITQSELGNLYVIPAQFKTLLYQLLQNSLKFRLEGKPLVITVKAEIENGNALPNDKLQPNKRYYHLQVKDNGIGFESQFSERIFEIFQKLHGKDEYEGNGIGLAICKKIVEKHCGAITATGRPGHGSVFDIYVPFTRT